MFSSRLPWGVAENRLARREAELRAEGRPLIDLTVTNPTTVGLSYPAAALAAALADPGIARYEPAPFGLPAARAAVAADYARRGVTVDPAAIALTASSSESYALLFKLLADPGDAILVPQPSYPLFDYLARLEGVEPRPYRLTYDGRWHVDWDSVDADGARAACLVSPNNPTGSFVTAEDLRRWDALAAERGLALIADEVFADYAFAPAPDAVTCPAASSNALTFSLGGLSKAAGLPQLKLGWIATTGPGAAEALARLELIADTYLSAGTPVQRALPELLALGAQIRAAISARVRANRAALILDSDSPVTLLPSEGGWSAILRVPAVMSDEEWALALLEDGVLVQPGYFFDLSGMTALVVSLLPADFPEGIRRLLARISSGL